MYQIIVTTAAKKDLKKVVPQVREIIVKEIFPVLSLDPFKGEKLKGIGYWKYKLSFQGAEFRIVYEIQHQRLVVLIIMIGPRENFYKRLGRRSK